MVNCELLRSIGIHCLLPTADSLLFSSGAGWRAPFAGDAVLDTMSLLLGKKKPYDFKK
jgi:hypothetical protein